MGCGAGRNVLRDDKNNNKRGKGGRQSFDGIQPSTDIANSKERSGLTRAASQSGSKDANSKKRRAREKGSHGSPQPKRGGRDRKNGSGADELVNSTSRRQSNSSAGLRETSASTGVRGRKGSNGAKSEKAHSQQNGTSKDGSPPDIDLDVEESREGCAVEKRASDVRKDSTSSSTRRTSSRRKSINQQLNDMAQEEEENVAPMHHRRRTEPDSDQEDWEEEETHRAKVSHLANPDDQDFHKKQQQEAEEMGDALLKLQKTRRESPAAEGELLAPSFSFSVQQPSAPSSPQAATANSASNKPLGSPRHDALETDAVDAPKLYMSSRRATPPEEELAGLDMEEQRKEKEAAMKLRRFPCDVCDRTFPTLKELREHIKDAHGEDEADDGS